MPSNFPNSALVGCLELEEISGKYIYCRTYRRAAGKLVLSKFSFVLPVTVLSVQPMHKYLCSICLVAAPSISPIPQRNWLANTQEQHPYLLTYTHTLGSLVFMEPLAHTPCYLGGVRLQRPKYVLSGDFNHIPKRDFSYSPGAGPISP